MKSAGDPDPMTYRALVELSARAKFAIEQAARDGHILELWAMGWPAKKIGDLVGLTPQRVNQIVRSVA